MRRGRRLTLEEAQAAHPTECDDCGEPGQLYVQVSDPKARREVAFVCGKCRDARVRASRKRDEERRLAERMAARPKGCDDCGEPGQLYVQVSDPKATREVAFVCGKCRDARLHASRKKDKVKAAVLDGRRRMSREERRLGLRYSGEHKAKG